jgi:O-acetyl-ADP-ribose deacetylase (regulator of RNase III)
MKQIKFGDITTASVGIIVHGCNAQGVMGSGIALAVKNKYPAAFMDYKAFCTSATLDQRLGKTVFSEVNQGLTIANSITQLNFGKDGKKYVSYKAIQECFLSVAQRAVSDNHPVHYPIIGAGFGGGDWAIISEIIDTIFDCVAYHNINRTLWIYE